MKTSTKINLVMAVVTVLAVAAAAYMLVHGQPQVWRVLPPINSGFGV